MSCISERVWLDADAASRHTLLCSGLPSLPLHRPTGECAAVHWALRRSLFLSLVVLQPRVQVHERGGNLGMECLPARSSLGDGALYAAPPSCFRRSLSLSRSSLAGTWLSAWQRLNARCDCLQSIRWPTQIPPPPLLFLLFLFHSQLGFQPPPPPLPVPILHLLNHEHHHASLCRMSLVAAVVAAAHVGANTM